MRKEGRVEKVLVLGVCVVDDATELDCCGVVVVAAGDAVV